MKNRKIKPWTIAGSLLLLALFAAFFYWLILDYPSPLSNITN